jgi:hypothetical protein
MDIELDIQAPPTQREGGAIWKNDVGPFSRKYLKINREYFERKVRDKINGGRPCNKLVAAALQWYSPPFKKFLSNCSIFSFKIRNREKYIPGSIRRNPIILADHRVCNTVIIADTSAVDIP